MPVHHRLHRLRGLPLRHRRAYLLLRIIFVTSESARALQEVTQIFFSNQDGGTFERFSAKKCHWQLRNVNFTFYTLNLRNLGNILTIGHLDFEETKSYHFSIRTTDSGFPALDDTTEVIVEVLDEDDNVPEFENRHVQFTVLLYLVIFSMKFLVSLYDRNFLACIAVHSAYLFWSLPTC